MPNTTPRTLWRPREGEPFPIDLMSDRHLNNAILMLRRWGYVTTHEPGPMPKDHAERVVWASKPAHPMLDALAEERLKRILMKAAPFTDEEAEEAREQWYMERRRESAIPTQLPPFLSVRRLREIVARLNGGTWPNGLSSFDSKALRRWIDERRFQQRRSVTRPRPPIAPMPAAPYGDFDDVPFDPLTD